MQDYGQAFNYIAALTGGDPNTTTVDFRCIHDTDKAVPAIPRRGTLPQLWSEICAWNNQGYGCFVNINIMDGIGHHLTNVVAVRAHAVDFDNLSAQQNFERAAAWYPSPSFGVQTSPGKFHAYWPVVPYAGNDRASLIQRKLRTFFDGDKSIIDPSRVLRLPGTLHLKNPAAPFLVTCFALPGYGSVNDPAALETALASVNVIDGSGGRHDLGAPELAAPSLQFAIDGLHAIDPNALDRGEWISITAAFKQCAWSHGAEQQLYDIWCQWCAQYQHNDPAENAKQWNSVRNTEVGWKAFERRVPTLQARRIFGERHPGHELPQPIAPSPVMPGTPVTPAPAPPQPRPTFTGEFLTDVEQREWFKNCVFIERMGEILTPGGRFMNATQFNGTYGGKKFIIDADAKVTNEAWQAATRSTLWTIPKADHIRFIPQRAAGELIIDQLGRVGVNTYKPAVIDARHGDVMPFIRHMEIMLPNENDRHILYSYLAHNAKFPGYKIPWAPLVQSVQGAGKGIIKRVMKHAMGAPYTYFPKAQELIQSGSKFNAWMRGRLFILVDEIKVDERRDMIEILKPMISEEEIEIQAKGIDQDIEDNYSNWAFFSNFKDAIPINRNDRRFSIFYSGLQNVEDLQRHGWNDDYFQALYNWLDHEGSAYVTQWLLGYPIERGAIPMRAPQTSSTFEAVHQSRGPVEVIIADAIADGLPGFRGGWISSIAVSNRLKQVGQRAVSAKTMATILEHMGYHLIGRALRQYGQESMTPGFTTLYAVNRAANVAAYGDAQGYA